VSPDALTAWIGVPGAAAGLVYGIARLTSKVVHAFDRVAKAVTVIETRSVQLEHNGGSSMRDDAKYGREAAEAALAISTRLEERFDRHLEQHSTSL
jgi:hypothetical protein